MKENDFVHDLYEQLLLPVCGRGALMWLDVVIASAANEGGNKWLRVKGGGKRRDCGFRLHVNPGRKDLITFPRSCRLFLIFPQIS